MSFWDIISFSIKRSLRLRTFYASFLLMVVQQVVLIYAIVSSSGIATVSPAFVIGWLLSPVQFFALFLFSRQFIVGSYELSWGWIKKALLYFLIVIALLLLFALLFFSGMHLVTAFESRLALILLLGIGAVCFFSMAMLLGFVAAATSVEDSVSLGYAIACFRQNWVFLLKLVLLGFGLGLLDSLASKLGWFGWLASMAMYGILICAGLGGIAFVYAKRVRPYRPASELSDVPTDPSLLQSVK